MSATKRQVFRAVLSPVATVAAPANDDASRGYDPRLQMIEDVTRG